MIQKTPKQQLWLVSMLILAFAIWGCGDEKSSSGEPLDGGDSHGDGGGDSDTDTDTDVDTDTTPGDATATAVPEIGPAPLQVNLQCTIEGGAAPFLFSWDFGDGYSSAIQEPSHTYVTVGDYTATCTVTDGNGKKYQGSVDIMVNDPDVAEGPVIDELSVNSGQGPDVPSNCAVVAQDQVQLTVLAHDQSESSGPPDLPDGGVDGGGVIELDPLIYQWVFESMPAGSVAVLNNANGYNPTFTPDRPGTYVVRVFVSDDQAGTVTLVTGTTAVQAGIGDRVALLGSATLTDGLAGELHYDSVPAEVQNFCGAKAANIPVLWTAENAIVPSPLPIRAGISSNKEEDFGQVRLTGLANGCPTTIPGSATLYAVPFYTAAYAGNLFGKGYQSWFASIEMMPAMWTWAVSAGQTGQLRVNLDRNVPILEGAASDPGQMGFSVIWTDGCGNDIDSSEVVSFTANIRDSGGTNPKSDCSFSTNSSTFWSANTSVTTFPTIHCDQPGDMSVVLTNVNNVGWGGECKISNLATTFPSASYSGAINGPMDNWTDDFYYDMLGPYSGYNSMWFDGSDIQAFGWNDHYYATTLFSTAASFNCALFRNNPYPYRLEWQQGHNLPATTGGYVMGSQTLANDDDFEVDSVDNWWPTTITPAYTTTVGGQSAWDAMSAWGMSSTDVTTPMAQWSCAPSANDWYFHWLYYVPENTALTDAYWTVDDVELWGWCNTKVSSEFTAGPYYEAAFVDWMDPDAYLWATQNGVIGCEEQPSYVRLVGYNSNGDPTPGASVIVDYTASAGTAGITAVHRGVITDPTPGSSATITLGPQGDAIIYFTSDAAGDLTITAVAATGGTDTVTTLSLYDLTAAEDTAAACGNGVDDNCNGRTDCSETACATTAACMPDLTFSTAVGTQTAVSYNGGGSVSAMAYSENIGGDDAGSHYVAYYVLAHDAIPTWSDSPSDSSYRGSQAAYSTSSLLSFSSSSLSVGQYSVWLLNDYNQTVTEGSETNNLFPAAASPYVFSVGPNLADDPAVANTVTVTGDYLDYAVNYWNASTLDRTNYTYGSITIYFMDSGVVPNGSNHNEFNTHTDLFYNMPAQGTGSVSDSSSIDVSGYGAGSYDVWVSLDVNMSHAEYDETDNDFLLGTIVILP
jgi:PKD repeat protein